IRMVYQVFIKTLTGRILTINLGNTEEEMQSVTVGQLKTKIFQMEGIPVNRGCKKDRQRLFFAGKQLEDIKRLFECRIQKEDTIHLILKVRGGQLP
uniref:Uncharacterized LOC103132215 n=1 Tax=Poecilia formosa TaxID=48698 RepID=A0A096MEF7_POEFO